MTLLLAAAQPVSGQRLLQDWRIRGSAGADALERGAIALFLNPASVATTHGRGELEVVDLRAPRLTGIDGLAAAGALAVNGGRTTFAAGIEHLGVSGIEETTTSPEGGAPLDVAENRLGVAAAHVVSTRLRVGAAVHYTRLPPISLETSILALAAGFRYDVPLRWPVQLAGSAVTEGDDAHWLAGAEVELPWRVARWSARGEYGASGGRLAPGVSHRLVASAAWADLAQLSVGALVEPGAGGRTVEPVVGGSVRLNRYRLGVVREQLPNGFGGAYSFRFSVGL